MTYEVEQGTGVYFIRNGAEKSHMISNSRDVEFVWFVQSLNNLQGCCNFFPQRLLTCLSKVNDFLHVIRHIDGRRQCNKTCTCNCPLQMQHHEDHFVVWDLPWHK